MDRLKYISTERMYEGIIVELTDAGVTIELKGRLGQFKIPKRMIISQGDLVVGQIVGFVMSYPEVLDPVPDEKYVTAIKENKRRIKEIKNRNNLKGVN